MRTALARLPASAYGTLYMDPPWIWMKGGTKSYVPTRGANTGYSFKSVGAMPYTGMSTGELLDLADGIRRIMAPDSHLYLWTVNKPYSMPFSWLRHGVTGESR